MHLYFFTLQALISTLFFGVLKNPFNYFLVRFVRILCGKCARKMHFLTRQKSNLFNMKIIILRVLCRSVRAASSWRPSLSVGFFRLHVFRRSVSIVTACRWSFPVPGGRLSGAGFQLSMLPVRRSISAYN